MSSRLRIGGWLALVAISCTPSVARDPTSARVTALFDPSAPTPVVPTPNDLAMDPTTGRVNLPDAPGAGEAEREYNRYLRTLDGFPASAAATCQFSAPLDPQSVTAAALRLLDVTDPLAISPVPTAAQMQQCRADCTLSPDEVACATDCPSRLTPQLRFETGVNRLSVKAPFLPGHAYAVAVIGTALRGAGGEEVVGSAAFVLLRARKPLTTCIDLGSTDCRSMTTLISGSNPEEAGAHAVALERARRQLQPALDRLERDGVIREQLAAAWSFRIASPGMASFDPGQGVVPFPSELLMKDGKVNLPPDPADDALAQQLKVGLNQLDGFSTTATLVTESSATTGAADLRLDSASLAVDQFRLINLENPSEEVPLQFRCKACGSSADAPGKEPDQVALIPQLPLRSHTRYGVLWLQGSKGLKGGALKANPLFALTRLSNPLIQGGKSTVSGLSDEDAGLLEPLRAQNQAVLAAGETRGLGREQVLLSFSFTTQTTSAALPLLAQKPSEWNLPTAVIGGPGRLVNLDLAFLGQISTLVGKDLSSHLRWAKEGELTSANALEAGVNEAVLNTSQVVPTLGAFTAGTLATPAREARRFLLVVPKVPRFPDGRIPVAVFQHGLGQSRRDALLIANTLAGAGMATVAIDAPFHGVRSFCQRNADCRSGVSCVAHRCPDDLMQAADGYKVRVLFGTTNDPLETPVISGDQFNSTTLLFATRDHLRQQVIDLSQLVRSIADSGGGIGGIDVDDPATAVVEKLDGAAPAFIGQSMGAIIGTLAVAAVPEFSAATLNVPGASLADISLTAPAFQSTRLAIDQYLTGRGTPPGSQGYDQFVDTLRWVLDPADGQNFGRHLIAEPLVDPRTAAPMPRTPTFISWVKGDQVVPNPTTELLLRSIDSSSAPQLFKQKQYQGGDHGFLLGVYLPNGASLALQAQEDAVNWVAP